MPRGRPRKSKPWPTLFARNDPDRIHLPYDEFRTPIYPKIPHFPWSYTTTGSPRIEDFSEFLLHQLILTEKMDGWSIGMTDDRILNNKGKTPERIPGYAALSSFYWKRNKLIPDDLFIYAEWCLFARGVRYKNLPMPLFIYAIRRDTFWLSWDDTLQIAASLSLPTVPLLWEGAITGKDQIKQLVFDRPSYTGPYSSSDGIAGFVLRQRSEFHGKLFQLVCGQTIPKTFFPDRYKLRTSWILPNNLA